MQNIEIEFKCIKMHECDLISGKISSICKGIHYLNGNGEKTLMTDNYSLYVCRACIYLHIFLDPFWMRMTD